VSVRRVNILELEPDELLEEAGFRHHQAELGPKLGSRTILATLYAADDGTAIWPYHYHYGVEEWLYVSAGSPVLRDPEGRRELEPGDLVCFPAGPGGAHALEGPGRFLVISTGTHREPWMTVYPDSGKVSGPEGILLASSRVEYWYGEGTWEPPGAPVEPREPRAFPRRPIVNLNTLVATQPPPRGTAPPGFAARLAPLGPELRAEMLGATLYELDPGEGTAPYHYHSGREEWLLVLTGEPTVRHPDGEDAVRPGDIFSFADGPGGAHRVLNRGSEPARLVFLSTLTLPVTAHYPDSGKILIRDAGGEAHIFRIADGVDYWDGEAGPGRR
jgi:uncharacterized cupin superfamily protein